MPPDKPLVFAGPALIVVFSGFLVGVVHLGAPLAARANPIFTESGTTILGTVIVDARRGSFGDFDNDGDPDLLIQTTSASDRVFLRNNTIGAGTLDFSDATNLLDTNDGNWEFTDVTTAVGLDAPGPSAHDSAWADFDLDRDLDLFAATSTTQKFFVSSANTNGMNWLYVRLEGRASNRTGIGARLYATIHAGTPRERTLRRDANANAGTFNQSDLPVHFGLGSATAVDTLRIIWPDQTVQVLHDVSAGQHLTITITISPEQVPVVSVGGWTFLVLLITACGMIVGTSRRITCV